MNNLNPHSRLASFYRYFYLKTDLPNNLCNYCWGLALAFICLPFVWTALAINYFRGLIYWYEYTDNQSFYVKDNMSNKETLEIRPVTVGYYNKPYTGHVPTLIGLFLNILIMFVGLIGACILESFGVVINKSNPLIASAYLYVVGVSISLLVSLIGYLGVKLARYISTLLPEKPVETDEEARERRYKEREAYSEKQRRREANPSVFTLAWRWIVAIKEENCPMINWDYDNFKKKK